MDFSANFTACRLICGLKRERPPGGAKEKLVLEEWPTGLLCGLGRVYFSYLKIKIKT
jgi:hypothetical protein